MTTYESKSHLRFGKESHRCGDDAPGNSGAGHPFKIIGSGFCVHPAGIVITANHVFQSFVKDQHHKSVLERVGEGVMVPTPMTVFGLLFYGGAEGSKVYMHEAVPAEVGIVNDFDIAVFKLRDAS